MGSDPLSFEQALRGLREHFITGCKERLDRMDRLIGDLEADGANEGSLRDLMIQFHGLSGSGSTYGFPRVSVLGLEGERLCDALVKQKTPPGQRDRTRWRSLLDSLRQDLEREPAVELPRLLAASEPFDILIVEPDLESRAVLDTLTRREGMSVRVTGTRAEALEELSRRMPDGAIVGVRLPDGSGYTLVERLRELAGGEGLAILMVGEASAFVNRVDAIHCGADGYFDMPLDGGALMRRLAHLLERGRAEPPRVLSVEDDVDQAAFLRGVMESAGYRVRICRDPGRMEADLANFRPDIVLLDIELPGTDGFALARYIRQQEAYAALPVLFLTTRTRLESQIESMRAGGDDYLIKPVAPGLLLSAAAARIERARFLKSLLERDGLTRLLTHTAFLERARALVEEKSRRSGASAAMALMDLDALKALNDRYGHSVGDTVLCSLAALLRRRLRQSVLLGRLGGDEFAAIIENIGEKQAVRLFEKIREEFAGTEQIATDGSRFGATFSAGVAVLVPGMDANFWRDRADAALYAAKSRGRNRVAATAAESA
ncbi:MAG TPA: response regulator [Thermoanaerobaculia bacterium]|nr:response regulator [Thermoanaerobaculia bacterium]